MKKRRLQDLYIVGREVSLNDESGDDAVAVWLQKLNAIEAETAGRRAGAARSRVMVVARDHSSEDWLDCYGEVADFSRETLVDIVLAEDYARVNQEAQAEIAAEEEWSEKDYLQGLRDSWFGTSTQDEGLKIVYESGDETNADYKEAARVYGELKRFDEVVQKAVDGNRVSLQRDMESVSLDVLRDKAVERSLAVRADSAFIQEFRRSQIYFGTREIDDHKKRYFNSREEVDELAGPILGQLINFFDALGVDVTEGKDSPPTPDSSPQSEQSDAEETAASSGPVVVNQ